MWTQDFSHLLFRKYKSYCKHFSMWTWNSKWFNILYTSQQEQTKNDFTA